ncbi:MAG: hypothetical protein ABIH37_02055 [archaeon]
MEETSYGEIKAGKPEFEPRDLLVVPHKENPLVVSRFGLNNYKNNLQQMKGKFSCLPDYPQITFRPAITSESISAVAYNFKNIAKPQIFDPNLLQAGYITRTSEGVFANPFDEQGNPLTDKKTLKLKLNGVKPIKVGKGNIYLCENGLAFAEYDSFKQGVQSSEDFSRSGLARILEHTEQETAENLEAISSPKNYKLGVNVFGFEPIQESVLRVAGLFSCRLSGVGQLLVLGRNWSDGNGGFAFGVLNNTGEASAQNSE